MLFLTVYRQICDGFSFPLTTSTASIAMKPGLLAFAFASTQLVSAGFLTAGYHHSYPDYCDPLDIRRHEPHVCFQSSVDIVKTFPPEANANFTGYQSGADPLSKCPRPFSFSA